MGTIGLPSESQPWEMKARLPRLMPLSPIEGTYLERTWSPWFRASLLFSGPSSPLVESSCWDRLRSWWSYWRNTSLRRIGLKTADGSRSWRLRPRRPRSCWSRCPCSGHSKCRRWDWWGPRRSRRIGRLPCLAEQRTGLDWSLPGWRVGQKQQQILMPSWLVRNELTPFGQTLANDYERTAKTNAKNELGFWFENQE